MVVPARAGVEGDPALAPAARCGSRVVDRGWRGGRALGRREAHGAAAPGTDHDEPAGDQLRLRVVVALLRSVELTAQREVARPLIVPGSERREDEARIGREGPVVRRDARSRIAAARRGLVRRRRGARPDRARPR